MKTGKGESKINCHNKLLLRCIVVGAHLLFLLSPATQILAQTAQ